MSFRTTCDRCVRHEASFSGSEPCEQHVSLSFARWSEFAFAYIAVELGKWVADTVFLAPWPARRRRCRHFLRGLTSE